MDILGLNVTSISVIDLLKLLLTVLDALAGGGTGASQKTEITGGGYPANCGIFAKDLYGKTINFLKNNFKQEDLTQINDRINWEKQEALKQEQPDSSHSRSRSR